jgi:WD40 repeat protein
MRAYFENNGRRVLTRSGDQTVRVWNANTGQALFVLRGHTGRIWSSRFHKGGSIVITASDDKTVRVWSGEDGSVIRVTDFSPGMPITLLSEPLVPHVVVLRGEGTLELWDCETGQLLRKLDEHEGKLKLYDGNSGVFVAASDDNVIRFWNLVTGSELSVIQEPGPDLRSMALSGDGKRLVTVHGPESYDKQATIKLWDAHSGKQVSQFDGHVRPMTAFSLGSDGSRLFTSTIDTNQFIDTINGKVLLFEEDDHAAPAVYNPQATSLASNQSHKVVILDTVSGAPLAILVHSGGPSSDNRLAFNTDGTRLVKTDGNIAVLWRIAPTTQALIDAVRASIPRCLSREQRIQAFLDPEPPAWCVEMEKWPYYTRVWKDWLSYKRTNATPPLPDTAEWNKWVAAHQPQ